MGFTNLNPNKKINIFAVPEELKDYKKTGCAGSHIPIRNRTAEFQRNR